MARIAQAAAFAKRATRCAAAFAFGLLFMPLLVDAVAVISMMTLISSAAAQPAALTTSQSAALDQYNTALGDFKSILSERRAQIDAKEKLPNVPGQALYLARNHMMSAYKDLTDALPSKIGRPNKFGIPPAYFDADNEPLIDEYLEPVQHHAGAARRRAELRYAIS